MIGPKTLGPLTMLLVPAALITAPFTGGGSIIAVAIALFVVLHFCNQLDGPRKGPAKKPARTTRR